MSLLVVGSVAFDALESPYGKVDRTLGGAATYFAVAASFFTHVSLVAIVGDDFTAKDAEIFGGRHIDTDGLERGLRPSCGQPAPVRTVCASGALPTRCNFSRAGRFTCRCRRMAAAWRPRRWSVRGCS